MEESSYEEDYALRLRVTVGRGRRTNRQQH